MRTWFKIALFLALIPGVRSDAGMRATNESRDLESAVDQAVVQRWDKLFNYLRSTTSDLPQPQRERLFEAVVAYVADKWGDTPPIPWDRFLRPAAELEKQESIALRVVRLREELDGMRYLSGSDMFSMLSSEDCQELQTLMSGQERRRAKRVLEIGSGVGYSTLCLAQGVLADGGQVVAIESAPDWAALNRGNIRRAGLGGVVHLMEGEATQVLPVVDGPFEFIFIDAFSAEPFYDLAIEKLAQGGLMVVHIGEGDEHMREVLEMFRSEPCLETSFRNKGLSESMQSGFVVSTKRCADAGGGPREWRFAKRIRSERVPASAPAEPSAAFERLRDVRHSEFRIIDLLVSPGLSKKDTIELCRWWAAQGLVDENRGVRAAHIWIYNDRDAFEHRYDLDYPLQGYRDGLVAQIVIRSPTKKGRKVEIRHFQGKTLYVMD